MGGLRRKYCLKVRESVGYFLLIIQASWRFIPRKIGSELLGRLITLCPKMDHEVCNFFEITLLIRGNEASEQNRVVGNYAP